jgi:hypothetical protein
MTNAEESEPEARLLVIDGDVRANVGGSVGPNLQMLNKLVILRDWPRRPSGEHV